MIWDARCAGRLPAAPHGLPTGVIRATVRDRVLAHDVAANVKLPRQRNAAAAMTIPTPAEVGALLREADPQFAAFVALCAFGGLRLGECAALKVSDVDFPQAGD